MMNRQGRPSQPEKSAANTEVQTATGNYGLEIDEPLSYELGTIHTTGVDLPECEEFEASLGGLERVEEIGIAGLSEPEVLRHYTRLSRKNYAIDLGVYPLGSCTMKHNPRLNEKVARLPGFSDIHPLQPQSTVTGAIDLMGELSHWLCELTGMPAVALSPKAGAHGELCGLMAIRAAHEATGNPREYVLVPESAHGTNPATATLCGYKVKTIPAEADGRVHAELLKEYLDESVAAIMLTNPNTCGLFEREIIEIADAVHSVGALFYCDGANFNAIMGRVRPGDLGIDAMHLNLHKTFSTPHGGGGPGSGPVVFSERCAPYMPVPLLAGEQGTQSLYEDMDSQSSIGRLTAFHGQMGMFTRALTYMLSHGRDGLKQASDDAVLSANYILASLKDVMTASFEGHCMHEALFDDRFLKNSGVTTLDFAKAMIDEGFHPMTMYFPLVVHGAMLIEPTESESKANLDQFIHSLRSLAAATKEDDVSRFTGAPHYAPMQRLDETAAARSPILRWSPKDE